MSLLPFEAKRTAPPVAQLLGDDPTLLTFAAAVVVAVVVVVVAVVAVHAVGYSLPPRDLLKLDAFDPEILRFAAESSSWRVHIAVVPAVAVGAAAVVVALLPFPDDLCLPFLAAFLQVEEQWDS